MKYLSKNNAVVIRQTEECCELRLASENIQVILDPFSHVIFQQIDEHTDFDHFVDKLFSIRSDFDYEDMSREELEAELDAFLLSLLQQGILRSDKPALWQPYVSSSVEEGVWELYFPYLRRVYQINEALHADLKVLTVHTYHDLLTVPFAKDSIVPLLEQLSAPVALYEHINYQYEQSRRLVLLPTTACNLKCEYCYAWREDKPVRNMTNAIAEAGINYTGLNALSSDSQSIDISFMGGGEPTCNWLVLKHAVEYARNIAIENGVPYSSTLTTNGVLSDEQISWIIENITFVKFSFDGIREVQEFQRPAKTGSSFEKAIHAISRLSDAGCNFLIRITVTNESISHLKDSISFIISNYTPNSIIINPVYVCGSCASHGVGSINDEVICKTFDEIQNMGAEKGIDIVIPYDKVTYMDVPRLPFCGFQKGNCFLTPEGYVSACSEIDGTDDPRAHIFFFGAWDAAQGELIINEEKEVQLQEISLSPNEQCSKCNNNIFCPGPCLVRRTDPETLVKFLELRKSKSFEESFSGEEMSLLINCKHSKESLIQCNMTKALTKYQVHRIVDEPDTVSKLALEVTDLHTPFQEIGVRKVCSIRCKG